MVVLVGIYLVQCVSVEVEHEGETVWKGAWTVSRSPSGHRHDWEPLTRGTTSQSFTSAESAHRAAEDEATAFARQLQGDDCLEPISWCMETSLQADHEVSTRSVRRASQRGATLAMSASSTRCSHLH